MRNKLIKRPDSQKRSDGTMGKIDEEYNTTCANTRTRVQDLSFDNQVDPLHIRDSEVTKLQMAMKQFLGGTELDIESPFTMTLED